MQQTKTHQDTDSQYFMALRLIFLLSFLLVGVYYELAASVVSIALIGLLLWRLAKQKRLIFRWNAAMAAVCLVWLFYLLAALWGVDFGLALWGGVKYLPLPLFGLCLAQTDGENLGRLLADIPWLGGAMTLLTFGLQYVPALNGFFSVNGRLAGFFQYPNTFACFLLLGIVLLLMEKTACQISWLPPICGAVLVFGLLQAGSRTVYLLTIPTVIACLAVRRRGKGILAGAAAGVCGVLLSVLLETLAGMGAAARITQISASASTLLGRLLYWKDALSVVAKNPLGLGYLGYYITQGSFQTGVYSVRWVHNDLLQLLLDVGWIPAVAVAIAVVRSLMVKKNTAAYRIVILVLLAHCMMDFDLEFVSMYFILLVCLDWKAGKTREVRFSIKMVAPLATVMGLAGLYIGLTSTLTYAGLYGVASEVYPWNTLSNVELLTQIEDMDELERLAAHILAQDDSVALAWNAKALVAYSQGNFGTYITAKRTAISLNPYSIEEYEDYFQRLAVGVQLYTQTGDSTSARICIEEIISIQAMLDELAAKTDPLAWKLADKPQLTMSQEYQEYTAYLTETT